MKRLNVKLAAGLLFGMVAVAGTIYLIHGWQVRRNADRLLDEAAAAGTDGEYRQQARLLAAYTQLRPDDDDAFARLAVSWDEITKQDEVSRKDFQAAAAVLERALRRTPEDHKLRHRAVDFYLRFGYPKDALAHLEQLPNDDPQLDTAEWSLLRAAAQMQLGDPQAAAAIYEQMIGWQPASQSFETALATAPQSLAAYRRLAALYRLHLRRPEQADAVMRQMAVVNQDQPQAQLYLGDYLLRHHRGNPELTTQGQQAIDAAYAAEPTDAEILLTAARNTLAAGDVQRAGEILKPVEDVAADNAAAYELQALVALRREQPEQALNHVVKGLKKLPGNETLLLMRGDLELLLERFDAAEQTAATLKAKEARAFLGAYLEGQIELRRGRWQQAAEKLEASLAELTSRHPQSTVQAYVSLARCYQQLGQPQKQYEAARRAAKANIRGTPLPQRVEAHWQSAVSAAELGRTSQALASLEELKQFLPARGRDNLPLLKLEYDLRLKTEMSKPADQRNWRPIEQLLVARVKADDTLDDQSRQAMGIELLLRQGESERAAERASQAIDAFPDESRFWLLKATAVGQQDGPAAALEVLEEGAASVGDSAQWRLAKAGWLLRQGGDELSDRLKELEKGAATWEDDEQIVLWVGLAELYRRLHRPDESARLLALAVEQRAPQPALVMALYQLALQMDDADAVLKWGDRLKTLADPSGTQAAYVDATRLVGQLRLAGKANAKALEALSKHIQTIRDTQPGWRYLPTLEADLAELSGDTESAIQHLQQASAGGAAAPRHLRRLVRLLNQEQRFDEAREAMRQLRFNPAAEAADVRQLSFSEAAAGNLDQALLAARQVASRSQRAGDHLWLGQLLFAGGGTKQAEAPLRKAVELAPISAEARLALIRYLVSQGQQEEAENQTGQLAATVSQPLAPLALGQAYEALGQRLRAQHHYESLLAAEPERLESLRAVAGFFLRSGDAGAAAPHLAKLLAAGQTSENRHNPHVQWARRAQARILAASGRYPLYRQAQALIAQNTESGKPPSSVDALLSAALAAARPDTPSRQSAASQLQSIGERRPLTLQEELALAQLLQGSGQWPACRRLMSSVLTAHEGHPAAIAQWCRLLLAEGELDELPRWLRRLDESPATNKLRAQWLARSGKMVAAAATIATLKPAGDSTDLQQLRDYAVLAEGLELWEEAEFAWRRMAELQPRLQLSLAAYLGRGGQLEETMHICSDYLEGRDIIAAVGVAMTALNANRANLAENPAAMHQAEQWLNQAIRDFPDASSLLIQQAMMHEISGRYDQAVRSYHRFIGQPYLPPSQQALAANNLAVLLASQGQCNEAEQMIDHALSELGPINEVLDTRAMVSLCYGGDEHIRRAIDDLKIAAVTSDNPVVRFHLALAHQRADDNAAARQVLDRALSEGLTAELLSPQERPLLARLQSALASEE